MFILLLKSNEANTGSGSDWAETLKAEISGVTVNTVSPLEFQWRNLDELTAKMRSDSHQGVVFTSQRSVQATALAVDPESRSKLTKRPFYVVGPATEALIADLMGWHEGPVIGRDAGSAKALAALLPASSGLLYPCGQLETLSSLAPNLDKIVVYETVKSSSLDAQISSLPDVVDVAVFFSPSGVRFALQTLLHSKKVKTVIAIGPTTFAALKDVGDVQVLESPSPTPEGVLSVIKNL